MTGEAGRLLTDLAPPDALRRLELTIVRRLDGYLRGEHLGLLPGPGSELAEARLYRPGEDDVRHMDWAVTARTTHPHVRDVVADRELETWALVDFTASMQFGTSMRDGRAVTKADLALAAVATVGVLTGRLGDRFGGYVLSASGLARHPARHGRLALAGLLRDIAQQPTGIVEPGQRREGVPLGPALLRMASAHPRRGLRVIVSDFLEPGSSGFRPPVGQPPEWDRGVRRLTGRHQVLAVEIVDPREGELPDIGVVELADPETGQILEIDTGRAANREAFARVAGLHRERVRIALRRAGAAHLILRTDSDWVRDIARFVLRHRVQARQMHRLGGR